ncbi:MAG TPA: D-alanine--D-alanine ligase [Candidatus Paceibacterota bacterium]|nr:D-alanine--D-alanine ligase [Candidatus Paceibacterota bacterium]
MSFAHKIRVAVLRGGPSSEYEVSLKSGEAVLKHLPSKYEGIDVFISREGVWHVHGIEKKPADALKHVDVAFLALHGQFGEDGKVQRILEHLGIPYTGSASFPSAVAMNKHLAKGALKGLKDKIKMAAHRIFTRDEIKEKGAHEIFRLIPHPSIVKPAAAGSSVGVTVVRDFFNLQTALDEALKHSDAVIVEELVEGREATVAVVDGFRGEESYALPPVEIIPRKESPFFDYQAKYEGKSQEICPGNFDEATKKALLEAARAIHRELGLRHYSRSDFIVHPRRGVFFLEANTLPGLTSESLLPKSVAAVGSSLPEFLDHVITLARS